MIKIHEVKRLWDISLWVFALFGVLITAGTAVPVIAAIFTYQSFIKESENAQKNLDKLNKQQVQLEQKIDASLPNLKQKFDSVAVLLQHNDMKKWAYEWSRKDKELTQQERDERFNCIDFLYSQLYDCSIYQLIVLKQHEIEQFEGEIAQNEAQYGEVRLCDYEMRLDSLNQELAELYHIASLSDKDFKPLYLQQLIYIWAILADRKEAVQQTAEQEKAGEEAKETKEQYLTEQMKAILLRFIQCNENNVAHIQVNEKVGKRLIEFAKTHLSLQEIEKWINPYKSSDIKFSNIIK
ncbi:hypothetical protein [Ursidibacter arcticus]|uniref:hypothetical protein n=1 Tax=Ursidibacter arcticus TaxID=1524965 RepID=UPI0012FCC0D9|nr:hypothetical protein [Ursidibacter arcticus]